MAAAPIRLAIVNDYEIVVAGLSALLRPFQHRISILVTVVGHPPEAIVDVILYDTFGAWGGAGSPTASALRSRAGQKVVVFSWVSAPEAIAQALAEGVDGYVHKSISAPELVAAIEKIHAGQRIVHAAGVSSYPGRSPPEEDGSRTWPGRDLGLSEREAEVIALICQGLSNEQVAARAFLSINTIKSYVRSAYRKMGVTSRSQAVLWGIRHGMRTTPFSDRADDPDEV